MVMKRGLIGVVLILTVLVVAGCKGEGFNIGEGQVGDEASSIAGEKYSGTQGLDIKFLDQLPPLSIYDTVDELVIVAEVRNMGAFGQVDADLYLTGYDPSIFSLTSNKKEFNMLEPKSQYSDGGIENIEYIPRVNALPEGTDDIEFDLSLIVCYDYETRANPVVCIDPRRENIVKNKDACVPEPVLMSGGQGAPVAVTRVDIESAGSKTYFKIEIENVGEGEVVSRAGSKCPFSLGYNDVDRISRRVTMRGGGNLDCGPSADVRLVNGRATIRCTYSVPQEERLGSYQTPLQIKLDYSYMQSDSRKLEIFNIE